MANGMLTWETGVSQICTNVACSVKLRLWTDNLHIQWLCSRRTYKMSASGFRSGLKCSQPTQNFRTSELTILASAQYNWSANYLLHSMFNHFRSMDTNISTLCTVIYLSLHVFQQVIFVCTGKSLIVALGYFRKHINIDWNCNAI